MAWSGVTIQALKKIGICLDIAILIKKRGGQPIFYMSVGRLMRLAQKVVKAAGFVPQNETRKGPVERRGTN